MPVPDFTQVILIELAVGEELPVAVPTDRIWKIESAGIAGANGTLFLRNNETEPESISILFSTIDNNDYGSVLPFWLPEGFTGNVLNDSRFKAALSITEYAV
jgi:hypothetical protein